MFLGQGAGHRQRQSPPGCVLLLYNHTTENSLNTEGGAVNTNSQIKDNDSFFFFFLWLHLPYMEVPRLGEESELQRPAYTTATATPVPLPTEHGPGSNPHHHSGFLTC